MTTIKITGSGSITIEGTWTLEGAPTEPPVEQPPPSGGGGESENPQAPDPPPHPAVQPGSSGRTITVGQQGLRTVAEAISAAVDGDTIRIPPNTPRESFVIYKILKIDGTGVQWDFSDVPAGDLIYQGKAAIVASCPGWHIQGMTISGAGIRESSASLVSGIRCDATGYGMIEACVLSGNQNGIGADNYADWDITVKDCLLSNNGIGDGYTHNIYVNDGYAIRLINTNSVDPVEGYALKSRAWHTYVDGGTFRNRTASLIDCANGGLLKVNGASLIKPGDSVNKRVLSYALEYDNKGLLDNNLLERTLMQLDCPDPFIQINGGTITFAADCTWHGNKVRVDGTGTVAGLP